MTNKLTFKHIEKLINAELYSLDEKIIFGKQKTITNLMASMNARQFNLFKKYLGYEKRVKAAMCTDVMRKCIKSIIENPHLYDFSDLEKDTKK